VMVGFQFSMLKAYERGWRMSLQGRSHHHFNIYNIPGEGGGIQKKAA